MQPCILFNMGFFFPMISLIFPYNAGKKLHVLFNIFERANLSTENQSRKQFSLRLNQEANRSTSHQAHGSEGDRQTAPISATP